MNKQDLIPLVEKVAEHRRQVAVSKKDRDWAESEMLDSAVGQTFESRRNLLIKKEEALVLAEANLKSAALDLYKETEDKKPIDKVEIKIFKRLSYSITEVLDWCKKNAQSLLIVNKKPFEKTAVEIGAPVEVTDEAKCTIGTDLSAYIKTKEEVKENE